MLSRGSRVFSRERLAHYGRIGVTLLQWSSVAFVVKSTLVDIAMCAGPSMMPTLSNFGDIILIWRVVSPESMRRGQVVIAVSPQEPNKIICKRVLWLEGDPMPWHAVKHALPPQKCTLTIPKGHVWVEGDNPDMSFDSRHYGPLPIGLIQGKAILKLWPLRNFGMRL